MDQLVDLLKAVWNPIATTGGAVAGALGHHLWGRFRTRLVTVRWTARVQSVAVSGHHEALGTVTVLHNGQPVDNLFVGFVEVQNDSAKDLADLEIQVGLRDGSTFVRDRGSVGGSLRMLSWQHDFASSVDQFLALEPNAQSDDVRLQLTTNRIYQIPAFNRGCRAEFVFLMRSPSVHGPTLIVNGDGVGIRFRELPARPLLLGEPQSTAGLVGFTIGLIAVVTATALRAWPSAPVIGAFLLGAVGSLVGVAALKLIRLASRLLS